MNYQSLLEHHAYHCHRWSSLDHSSQMLLIGAALLCESNLDWLSDYQAPSNINSAIAYCIAHPDAPRNASLASDLIDAAWSHFARTVEGELNAAVSERMRELAQPDVDEQIDRAKEFWRDRNTAA